MIADAEKEKLPGRIPGMQTMISYMRGEGGGTEERHPAPGSGSSSLPNGDSEFRANDRRVQIPQWLLLFLIVQGGTIIWWAANTTSNQRYYEQEKARLEAKVDNEIQNLKSEIRVMQLERQSDKDKMRDVIRDEVTNQMLIMRARPAQ